MIHYYCIAGIHIAIHTPFEYQDTNQFLPFVETEPSQIDFHYFFSYTEKTISHLPLIYQGHGIKVYENNYREVFIGYYEKAIGYIAPINKNKIDCFWYAPIENEIGRAMCVYKMLSFENILLTQDMFILHSSFISYQNKAILFSAPSGTGKSTQANLWKTYVHASIVNGDRSIIKKEDEQYYAYGSPYAGSSNIYKNEKYPIQAIVILKQAPLDRIIELSTKEKFIYLLKETTMNQWDKAFVEQASAMLMDMITAVPVYLLECTKEKSAVECLKSHLKF